jgi:hypothetical protein
MSGQYPNEMDAQNDRRHNKDQGALVQLAKHFRNAHVSSQLFAPECLEQVGKSKTPNMA